MALDTKSHSPEFASVYAAIEDARVEIKKDLANFKTAILQCMFRAIGLQTLVILVALVTLVEEIRP